MNIEDAVRHYNNGGIIKGIKHPRNTVLCYYEPMKQFHMVEKTSGPATKEINGWVKVGTREEFVSCITRNYKYINTETGQNCENILVSIPDMVGNIVVLVEKGRYALAHKNDIKKIVDSVEAWDTVKEMVEVKGYTFNEAYETLNRKYWVL